MRNHLGPRKRSFLYVKEGLSFLIKHKGQNEPGGNTMKKNFKMWLLPLACLLLAGCASAAASSVSTGASTTSTSSTSSTTTAATTTSSTSIAATTGGSTKK